MNDLFNAIFGAGELGFGDEGVSFGWARPVPGWGWALIVLASAGLAWWSYRRLVGAVRWRAALASVRGLILVLLAMLASGPRLVKPHERVERDWVVVLVDRSGSMEVPDGPGAGPGRVSREAQLSDALRRAWPELSVMDASRHVMWMGFGGAAFELGRTPKGEIDLGEPGQRRTSLAGALDDALRRTAGRRVSAVVVMSDGRSIDEPSRAALRRIEAERIKVVTVPLGSGEPIGDIAVANVDAPDEAFVGDAVPVRVDIDQLGQTGGGAARVQLVDDATGLVLDERMIESGDWTRTSVTLATRPDRAEDAQWTVRLVPLDPDLVPTNNAREASVTLVERPMRVVYFDGYPRWEYRFVKNLLIREGSILSSSMLLAGGRRYLQEGEELLEGVPRSPEEWARFDVIVMGDVRADVLSPMQQAQIREHVAGRGGGLLWIGGEGATPSSWAGTPLGDLLPFTLERGRDVASWDSSVVLAVEPLADALGVLRLDDPGESRVEDPGEGWTRLLWAQRIEPATLKPTAEVLASAQPVNGAGRPDGDPTPLVMTMRYGAGRVIYVATDETWRLRFGRGEVIPERFWIPLIRMLGQQSLSRSGKPAVLEVSPRRSLTGEPVRFALHLLDQSLIDRAGDTMTVWLRPKGDRAAPAQDVPLMRRSGDAEAGVVTFEGAWSVSEPGEYIVEPSELSLRGAGVFSSLTVMLDDDELREPQADHALLARLVDRVRTGAGDLEAGETLSSGDLARLPEMLPVRDITIEAPPTIDPLWDRAVVLILLLSLLVAEWVGRRLLTLA
ncbi:MAG: hypothetical protein H6811_07585 [Phycisphaeraceae bacterium]|nr:hypothetical protein [Phycisphaeraceae bacterium]